MLVSIAVIIAVLSVGAEGAACPQYGLVNNFIGSGGPAFGN